MEDKEYSNVYAIPANYTDSGKLFGGMVDTRNAVEAVLLLTAVGAPELFWIPMSGTIRVVVMTVTLIPLGVVAVMGVDGGSLFQYIAISREETLRRGTMLAWRIRELQEEKER